jgi:hypothetical protein
MEVVLAVAVTNSISISTALLTNYGITVTASDDDY